MGKTYENVCTTVQHTICFYFAFQFAKGDGNVNNV